MGRRRRIIVILLLISFFSVISRVEASDGMRGANCEVPASEHITEDLYFLCRTLDVKGSIDGDLIGAASEVVIHPGADITGNVWVLGGKLTISGSVGDDVHFGGVNVVVTDEADFPDDSTDLAAIGLNVEIKKGAVLPGDLLVYGYQAQIAGSVNGDVDFGGETLVIKGRVRGKVDAQVGDPRRSTDIPGLPIYDVSFIDPGLSLSDSAVVEGDLTYRATRPSIVPSGVVNGTLSYEDTGTQRDITKVVRADDAAKILVDYARLSIRDLASLMIVGVAVLLISPSIIRQSAQHVRRRVVPTVGWGMAAFMLTIPMMIVVFLISLLILLVLYLFKLNDLTVMVGVGVLVLTSATVGGFAFLLFFMGRIVISFVLGQLIYRYALRIPDQPVFRRWVGNLAMGGIAYALLTNMPLPVVGVLIELATALAGVGAVVMVLRQWLYSSGQLTPRAALAFEGIGVPALSDEPLPPGMDNLPEGFTGFDED